MGKLIPPVGIELILPIGSRLQDILSAKPSVPFAPERIAFVEEFGRQLRMARKSRQFPELVALGFWARAANIEAMRQRYCAAHPNAVRLPRGKTLHIAPANVDTIFVYSLLLSMLAGNVDLVRISSRAGQQSDWLLQILQEAADHADAAIRNTFAVIRYDHDRAITAWLSAQVDMRVIWGGNAAIAAVRQAALTPMQRELVFPNRSSLAVISARAWLEQSDGRGAAHGFAADALWFGQQACSSARSVVWVGGDADCQRASADFWRLVDGEAASMALPWEPAYGTSKLLAEQSLAVAGDTANISPATNIVRVVLCPLNRLSDSIDIAGGFFREFRVAHLADLAPLVQSDWQTVSSFGIDKADWRNFLTSHCPSGIDRIVPFGQALAFDHIWDGKDILAELTRIVKIPD